MKILPGIKQEYLAYSLKALVLTLILIHSSCSENSNHNTLELYVSVTGNDEADGSISSPLATLPVAVDKVRELRRSGNADPVVIYLREGRHQLNQTLVLGLEDGNPATSKPEILDKPGAGEKTEPAYLTFAAFPGEHPVVSAGLPVTEWQKLESAHSELPEQAQGKVWVADIPAGLERFYTLYDNQGRLNRARAKGFVPTREGDNRTLHFPDGALKNWHNLKDVEINIRPGRAWLINMLPIESVDEENGIAKTAVNANYGMGKLGAWVHTRDGYSAWIENTLEALDEPGEWVVSSESRKIYLWPSDPATDGSPRGILAPGTSEIIRIEGAIDFDGPADVPVRGIVFSGLTFSHGDRWAWTDNEYRVGWEMNSWDTFDRPTAMLRFRGTEDCQVSDCRFIQSGGTGLRMDFHTQGNRVENCEFAHLGEAGILMAGYGPGTKDVNHHNDIINNHIHHFSEITWHSPSILVWQSGYNHITNNYIHHAGYSGVIITCGNPARSDRSSKTVRQNEISEEVRNRNTRSYENWKMREKYSHSRHNLFEYNEITHCVQLLSDGNGIYLQGAGKGNIVRYNYLHDNLEHSLPACIRCDDDQHETLIYGNILYNNFGYAAGIASKGTNHIINNFIVAPQTVPFSGYISFEWVPVPGSNVYKNIIIPHPDGGKAYGERPRRDQTTNLPNLMETEMDSNLYYNPADPEWMVEHFKRTRAAGLERASLFGDPLFTDPEGGDFSFKEGSPALKLGIEPLDVSKMGLKSKL